MVLAGATQLPMPSQADAGVDTRRVASQAAARQTTPLAAYGRQAPRPSQVPSPRQGAVESVGHAALPAGGRAPAAMFAQCPVPSHASQLPVQALSQQIPPTQARD